MAQDFYFQSGHSLDLGTPKQCFENNKQAIQIAKDLASSGRIALPEELTLLSKYVGWGDSRFASPRVPELPDLLTEDELRSARGSTINYHCTTLHVIGAMGETVLLNLAFQSAIAKLQEWGEPIAMN